MNINRRQFVGAASAALGTLGLIKTSVVGAGEVPAKAFTPFDFFTRVELQPGELPMYPTVQSDDHLSYAAVFDLETYPQTPVVTSFKSSLHVPTWELAREDKTEREAKSLHDAELHRIMGQFLCTVGHFWQGPNGLCVSREVAETSIRKRLRVKDPKADFDVRFCETGGYLIGVNIARPNVLRHVVRYEAVWHYPRFSNLYIYYGEHGLAILDCRVIAAVRFSDSGPKTIDDLAALTSIMR